MARSKSHRIIAIIVAFLIGSIIIYSIGSIIVYFKTGAKKLNKYDAGISLLVDHNPIVTWLPDDRNIGGDVNPFIRKKIEDSYIDAWGILHLSLKNKKDLGLEESFSDQKSEQIRKSYKGNNKLIKEDLEHNLKLHFISKDKQVASITDYAAIIKTSLITESETTQFIDTSDYKIMMTLNDGKWRINKFHRMTPRGIPKSLY